MTINKPEIEQLIQAFNASSSRARTLLIGLLFASILAFIALIDSLKPNYSWYSTRIEIHKVALQWFIFPDDQKENHTDYKVICCFCDSINNRVVDTLEITTKENSPSLGFNSVLEFADSLEQKEADSSRYSTNEISLFIKDAANLPQWLRWLGIDENQTDLPYWVRIKPFETVGARKNPDKEKRKKLYESLARAAAIFNSYSPHSRQELEYALENLMEAQSENLTLVRMPILGISFDINYLGFISGGIFYALMALLYLSMVREDRNLKTLFNHGWQDEGTDNRRLYELLSMYQVLTVPQKLYRPDDIKDMNTRKFILGVFWSPFLVLFFIFIYDLSTFKIGLSLNPFMTILTSFLTLVSLLLIGITSLKLSDRQTRINRLWDNQYFRLHLDKFFSPNTQTIESSPFATLAQAKINWANAAYAASLKKQMSENECVRRFRKFLNLCYDKFEDKRIDKISDAQETAYWAKLEDWYEQNHKHSTRKLFRKELTEMMNNLQLEDTDRSLKPSINQ